MYIKSISFLLAVATFSLSSGKPPNIIFIFADDYGWNDIGYHKSEIKTPNLDQLAADGVKLENYYVQPICTPSRSQFMSGRYQIHTGLQHNIIWGSQPNGLPLDSATIADKIKQAGYSTHAIGKWHLGFYKDAYLPTNRGFDSFYGFLTGSESYFSHRTCDSHEKGIHFCGLDFRNNTAPVVDENHHYSTTIFTERAVDVIKNHDQSKPFFMYLAYQAVHGPLQVPDKYMEPYKSINDKKRRTYAGMAACMDEGVGNITKALHSSGQWDNTLIVFSTDNGGLVHAGANNWPLRGGKATLWEGGMRGVGFVHGSMLSNKGTINHELIHVSDWFPTLVGVAGGNTHGTKPLDGFDQWKTISTGAASPRTELLHNIDILHWLNGKKMFNDTFDTRIRAAIRVGDWKLITGDPGNGSWIPPPHSPEQTILDGPVPDKNLWLFNIANDPNEHNDLSASNPTMVKKLLDRLLYYNTTAVPPVYPNPDPNCDPKKHGGVWGPWDTGAASPRTELLHNIDILHWLNGKKMFNDTFDTRIRAAIRVGDWKLITGDPGNGSWIPPPHSPEQTILDGPVPDKNLWLFNIANDPNEHNDLSASNPTMVKKLLDRLLYYNTTAVPPVYPNPDPNCDPKKHGGVWGPWE